MANITKAGAPDWDTVGSVGDICTDTITGRQYELVSIHKHCTYHGVSMEYSWKCINNDDEVSDETIYQAVNEYLDNIQIDGAIVTSERIIEALDYTPADQEDVNKLNEKLVQETGKLSEDITGLNGELDKLNEGGLVLKDEVIEQDIKNWLDEHPEATTTVQDGSLTDEKFTLDTRKKKAIYYNCVADMITYNELKIGMTAVTLGYYRVNDGGGGIYHIREKTTNDIDGGDIQFISDTLVAELITDYANVKQFGAKGDGVSNDTEFIKKAISKYNTVYFPKGTYLVSESIKLRTNNVLCGDGFDTLIKCSTDFIGTALIVIDSVLNTELKNITLHGGSVFNHEQPSFDTLNGKISAISCKHTTSHIAVCRIENVQIILFSHYGIVVDPSTYEIIANKLVVKYCYHSGIYNRGTDGFWSNVYIGMCAFDTSVTNKQGAKLEGGNNNYLNFKIYLCPNDALYLESGTNYNNYQNFNIQECNGYGLGIASNAFGNNLEGFVIDSCKNGIHLYKTSTNHIAGAVSNTLSTIETNNWLVAYECVEPVYLDIMALTGKKNTDNTNLVFGMSN